MSTKAPVKQINLHIPSFRDAFRQGLSRDCAHTFEGVTVVTTKNVRLYKTRDGMIFADRSNHLYDGWRMNDVVRRAWCKLSGVKFADLKAAIKAHKEGAATKKAQTAVNELKTKAARVGYRLVKQ